jgi:DNA-binding MarR family transcriptional regulator
LTDNNEIDKITSEMCIILSILITKFMKMKFETRTKKKISRNYLDTLMIINSKEDKKITMGELGKRIDMPKPNVTKLIDKLIELKFVKRINSENDRRVIFIQMTKEGNDFLSDFMKEFKIILKKHISTMSKSDLKSIKNIFTILKKIII